MDKVAPTSRIAYPWPGLLGTAALTGCLLLQAHPELWPPVSRALAQLAKEEVPESVKRAYNDPTLNFGPEYIIPKPFDPRVLVWAASAVAEAAIKTGVARSPSDILRVSKRR